MKRRALLVLGMHRSGTSALAGLLGHLGAAPPRTLMPPDAHNALGYWESLAFCQFHDRFLRDHGTSWDSWTEVDPGLLANHDAVADQEFARTLEQEFGDSSLIVVKDPRICRFVGFWLEGLADAGIEALPVLIVRDPVEVARSLAARDGFDETHSLLLWLRHVLDAEHGTRDLKRVVIQYDDILADWRGVASRVSRTFDIQLGVGSDGDDSLSSFLRRDLRHHIAKPRQMAAPDALRRWVLRAYDAITDLARPASRPAESVRTLEEVRDALNEATRTIGPLFDRERRLHGENNLKNADDKCHMTTMLAEREAEAAQLRHSLATAQVAITAAEADAKSLRGEIERLRAAAECLERQLQNQTARVNDLEASFSWRLTRPLRAIAGTYRR